MPLKPFPHLPLQSGIHSFHQHPSPKGYRGGQEVYSLSPPPPRLPQNCEQKAIEASPPPLPLPQDSQSVATPNPAPRPHGCSHQTPLYNSGWDVTSPSLSPVVSVSSALTVTHPGGRRAPSGLSLPINSLLDDVATPAPTHVFPFSRSPTIKSGFVALRPPDSDSHSLHAFFASNFIGICIYDEGDWHTGKGTRQRKGLGRVNIRGLCKACRGCPSHFPVRSSSSVNLARGNHF